MLPQKLIDILVCPACRQPLTYREERPDLRCGACGRVYPVRDGIPVLLIDQATVEPS